MISISDYLQDKSHVIWDWNGTLLDDVDLAVSAINQVMETHQIGNVDRKRYLDLFRFPVLEYYKSLGFDLNKVSFEELSEGFISNYKQGLASCQLHRGAKDFLTSVKDKGKTQSVLSAAHEEHLKQLLSHYQIDHLFDNVCGLSDIYAAGKVDRGIQLLAQVNTPKEATILIGDTDHDFEVGEALGIDVLLLADGHQSYERLAKIGGKVLRVRE